MSLGFRGRKTGGDPDGGGQRRIAEDAENDQPLAVAVPFLGARADAYVRPSACNRCRSPLLPPDGRDQQLIIVGLKAPTYSQRQRPEQRRRQQSRPGAGLPFSVSVVAFVPAPARERDRCCRIPPLLTTFGPQRGLRAIQAIVLNHGRYFRGRC